MSAGGSNEPNLTPFIDLFSVLVCFLLMTAAWLQLEALQINIDPTPPPSQPSQAPEPLTPTSKVKLSVKIFPNKVVLSENQTEIPIPNDGNDLDKNRIGDALRVWRLKYTEQLDVVLNTDNDVKYGSLIAMYDLLIASEWPDVAINPN